MTERFVCIHGHFYQPPRENAWLESVQLQDSAYPYHDWNERITDECYAPNAHSRILGADGHIRTIVNNYGRISFNFGPTLLAWLESEAPGVYRSVIAADAESASRFGGHGSAMAQAYSHAILPLCNARDRRTQVLWGVHDFERRFGRSPAGMWLPETAVDTDTLEALAEAGIAFTVLEPGQARRWRRLGTDDWCDVGEVGIDPTRPYRCSLPSGRQIAVFFYDGPISRAVAFEGLLTSGERFAHRVLDGLSSQRAGPQLAHIATDGETYGHHHRHGDMALAYALQYLEERGLARLTNYGEYLANHPPEHEVQIAERTSWSCAHGIERWRSDCGCSTGGQPGWNQAWRAPLRDSLDWLRDAVLPQWEAAAKKLFVDPWKARDAYISVILDRSPESREAFLRELADRRLTPGERVAAFKLLEMQRHAMLMYTSCGWFFDDLARIETVQVLQYAARVVQLAEEVFDDELEAPFLARLERARSNDPSRGSGRDVWNDLVKPSSVTLIDVAAHYAVSSLFDGYDDRAKVHCYLVERDEHRTEAAGGAQLALGRVRVTSSLSEESANLAYGALHLGDHNLTAGVSSYESPEAYGRIAEDVVEVFGKGDLAESLRRLDRHFHGCTYSLRSLFQDERRRVIERILEPSLQEARAQFRGAHQRHAALMHYLVDLSMPLPRPFAAAAGVVVHTGLREVFDAHLPDVARGRELLAEARALGLELDAAGIALAAERCMRRLVNLFTEVPEDVRLLDHLVDTAELARALPFSVDLWDAQNAYYELAQRRWPEQRERAKAGQGPALQWTRAFRKLGQILEVHLD